MSPEEESLYLRYLDQLAPKRPGPTGEPHTVTLPFLARYYENFLLDGFGTLYVQDRPLPGAVEAVQILRAQKRNVRLLTNAASRTSETIASDLRKFGFDFQPSEIIASGDLLAVLNTRLKVRQAFHLGKESAAPLLESAGIDATADPQSPVVIATSHQMSSPDDIVRAESILSRDGALLVVLNPDAMAPDHTGLKYPVCGILSEGLRHRTGCHTIYCGKPFPLLYQVAQRSLVPSRGSVLCIGDTLGTDIAGAKLAGLDAALLLSGNSYAGEIRDEQYRLRIRPDYYIEDLGGASSPNLEDS